MTYNVFGGPLNLQLTTYSTQSVTKQSNTNWNWPKYGDLKLGSKHSIGTALTVHHRRSGILTYMLHGFREGDKQPACDKEK